MTMVEEAIQMLVQYGFRECTQEACQQDCRAYLCAFDGSGVEEGMRECCVTEDDLLALVALVEASAGTMRA